jgi:hypothetical protein
VEPLGGLVGRADLLSSLVFLVGFKLSPENTSSSLVRAFYTVGVGVLGSLFKENAIVVVVS